MRLKDNGIGPTPVTQWADAFPPMATSKVGMFIGAPDVIQHLVEVLGANKDLYGMGPIPGSTGPATGTLAGGDLYYFKKGLTPNQIKAEIAWITFEYLTPGKGQFDFARAKDLASSDKPVAIGLPREVLLEPDLPADDAGAVGPEDLRDAADPAVRRLRQQPHRPGPRAAGGAADLQGPGHRDVGGHDRSQNADPAKLLSTAESQVNSILANQ